MEPNRTRHQEKIIKNFYRNRSDIALQRAQELISELYLTQGKKRERAWENLVTHLEALGLPASQIEHLRTKDDPALVAEIVQKIA
jgi:acetylornithine deacetylase/succinyl-diaminopimelate desuccinylase-like protein